MLKRIYSLLKRGRLTDLEKLVIQELDNNSIEITRYGTIFVYTFGKLKGVEFLGRPVLQIYSDDYEGMLGSVSLRYIKNRLAGEAEDREAKKREFVKILLKEKK